MKMNGLYNSGKVSVVYLFVFCLTVQPAMLNAQITVDPYYSEETDTTEANNGVEIVNIAQANAAGLSHNRYTQFNVQADGLILNNATSVVQTDLAGFIQGNTNLTNGSANLILNEITSTQRSVLNGYMEVAGQKAAVIVANPNGITCEGCGFINTPRATLTTGTPEFNGGQLSGFNLRGGDISIQSLNAGNIGQLDLLARAIQINGELYAKTLNVITGQNSIGYPALSVTSHSVADGSQPALALDVATLGGMYANSIRLIGTEAGVGVSIPGDLAASSGDLTIDVLGQLTLANTKSSGTIRIKSQDLQLSEQLLAGQALVIQAQNIASNALVTAADDIIISGNSLVSEGSIAAGSNGVTLQGIGALSLTLDSTLTNSGELLASGFADITAASLDNDGGKIASVDTLNLNVRGNLSNTRQGTITTDDNLKLVASTISNTNATISAAESAQIVVGSLHNSSGDITAHAMTIDAEAEVNNVNGLLFSHTDLAITGASLNNNAGELVAVDGSINAGLAGAVNNSDGFIEVGQQLQLSAHSIDNRKGTIKALGSGDSALIAATFIDSTEGIIAANSDNFTLSAGTLSNHLGLLSHNGAGSLTLALSSDLENKNATIVSAGTLNLSAADVNNSSANLRANQINIAAKNLLNDGGSISADRLNLFLNNNLHNGLDSQDMKGIIDVTSSAADAVVFSIGGQFSNDGDLTINASGAQLTLGELANSGTILHEGAGLLALKTLKRTSNSGLIYTDGSLVIAAGGLANRGDIYSDTSIKLNADTLTNINGTITNNSDKIADINLVVGSAVDNTRGVIGASGALMLSASSLDNTHGSITSLGIADTTFNLSGALLNGSGYIGSRATNLLITATSLINAATTPGVNSQIIHAGAGQLRLDLRDGLSGDASTLTNSLSAEIISKGQLNITAGAIDNQAATLSANAIIINAVSLDNDAGTLISERLKLALSGDLSNGVLADSDGVLIEGLINQRGSASDDLSFTVAGALNNVGGYIQTAATDSSLTAATVNNSGYVLHRGAGTLTLDATDALNNQTGIIEADNAMSLKAGSLSNTGGSIATLTGDLAIAVSGLLDNQQGSILGKKLVAAATTKLIIDAGSIDNSQGRIDNLGQGDTVLNATGVMANNGGSILANSSQMYLIADSVSNANKGVIEHFGDGSLNITAGKGDVDNQQGGLIRSANALVVGSPSGHLDNRSGSVVARSVTVQAIDLDNRGGTLSAVQTLNLTASGDVLNGLDASNSSNGLSGFISALGTAIGALEINISGLFDNGDQGTVQTNAADSHLKFNTYQGAGNLLHFGNGTLKVEAIGDITNNGLWQSIGQIELTAENLVNNHIIKSSGSEISFNGGSFTNKNLIQAADGLSINASSFTNAGDLFALGTSDSGIAVTGAFVNQGYVAATSNNFNVSAGSLSNTGTGSEIYHQGSGTLAIHTKGLLNNQAKISSDAALIIGDTTPLTTAASNTLNNERGEILADNLSISAGALNNIGAVLEGTTLLSLEISDDLVSRSTKDSSNNELVAYISGLGTAAQSTLIRVGGKLDNGSGSLIQSNGPALSLAGSSITNDGIIYLNGSDGLTLNTDGALTNTGRIETNGNVGIDALSVANTGGGIIKSDGGNLAITTSGTLNNDEGWLQAASQLELTANDFSNRNGTVLGLGTGLQSFIKINRLLDNSLGRIQVQQCLKTHAEITSNNQGIMQANRIEMTGAAVNNLGGSIEASTLDIDVTGDLTNGAKDNDSGLISANSTAANALDLDIGGAIVNQAGGIIQSIATTTLSSASFNNQGTIYSLGQGALKVITGIAQNSGKLQANGRLSITAEQLVNSGTLSNFNDDLTLIIKKGLNNNQGEIEAAGNLILHAGSMSNQQGSIKSIGAAGSSELTVTAGINNDQGHILSNANNLTLKGSTISNQRGAQIAHFGDGVLRLITTHADAATINNQGGHLGSVSTLLADSFDSVNNSALDGYSSEIQATHIELTSDRAKSSILNNGGKLFATGANSLLITTDSLSNNGGLVDSVGNMTLNAATLANDGGLLQSDADFTLNLASFDFTNGQFNAGGNLIINTSGDLNNGVGNFLRTGGSLAVNTDGALINHGEISTKKDLTLNAKFLHNLETGIISAGRNLLLTMTGIETTLHNLLGTNTVTGDVGIVNQGRLSAKNNAVLQSTHLHNFGTIGAGANLMTTLSGSLNNHNALFAGNDAALYADSIVNSPDFNGNGALRVEGPIVASAVTPVIFAVNSITVAKNDSNAKNSRILNESATIEAYNGDLNVNTQSLVNRKQSFAVNAGGNITADSPAAQLLAGGNMSLKADNISNYLSLIAADGALDMLGTTLLNEGYGSSGEYEPVGAPGSAGEWTDSWAAIKAQYEAVKAEDGRVDQIYYIAGEGWAGTHPGNVQEIFDRYYFAIRIVGDQYYRTPDAEVGDSSTIKSPHDIINAGFSTESYTLDETPVLGTFGKFFDNVYTHTEYRREEGHASTIQAGGALTGTFMGQIDNVNIKHNQGDGYTQGTQKSTTTSASVSNVTQNNASGLMANTKTTLKATTTVGQGQAESKTASVSVTAVGGPSRHKEHNTDVTAKKTRDSIAQSSLPGSGQAVQGKAIASPDGIVINAVKKIDTANVSQSQTVSRPALVAGYSDSTTNEELLGLIQQKPVSSETLAGLSGLFQVNTAPDAKYIVEMKPEFAQYQHFISSDYLLERLNIDNDTTSQRLGDGFYEYSIVKEAVFDSIGRDLQNTANVNAYQQLMDSALSQQQALQLSIGIALSVNQIANLQDDMVWLVTQEVAGKNVLVPVFYKAQLDDADLNNGAMLLGSEITLKGSKLANEGLIRGSNSLAFTSDSELANSGKLEGSAVELKAVSHISNTGRMSATEYLSLVAGGNVINSGDLSTRSSNSLLTVDAGGSLTNRGRVNSANRLSLAATDDLVNQPNAGITSGGDMQLQSRAGSIIQERTAIQTQRGSHSSTTLSEGGRISADGNLLLAAGEDIRLRGTDVAARGNLGANAGRDIAIRAIETRSSSTSNNGRKISARVNQTAASVTAGGDVVLVAGRDSLVSGSSVTAGHSIGIVSGGNTRLEAVAESRYDKNDRGKKKAITSSTTHVGSGLTAGHNVSLQSGGDLAVIGSNITAGATVNAITSGDTTIGAVQDKDYRYSYEKVKKSFGRKKVTEEEESISRNVGSSIIAGKDVLINTVKNEDGKFDLARSGDVDISGSDLNADKELVVFAGNTLTLDAGTESYEYSKKVKKRGFAGLSGSTRAQEAQRETTIGTDLTSGGSATLISGSETNVIASTVASDANISVTAGRSGQGDVNIINGVDTDRKASSYEKKSIGLSFSGGAMNFATKNSNNQDVTQASNAASSLSAKGNVSISGTNINIQASEIKADASIGLKADQDVNITAGVGSSTSSAAASSQAIGIGVSADRNAVSVFAGSTSNEFASSSEQTNIFGSNIAAGENVVIEAGNDIGQIGSAVSAGDDAFYNAGNDIILGAAIGVTEQTSSSRHSTTGLGVSIDHGLGRTADAVSNAGKAVGSASGNGAAGAVSGASGVMAAADAITQSTNGPTLSAHAGNKSTETTGASSQENAVLSSVRTGGSATFIAGGDATFEGSNFQIGEDLNISAIDVNLLTATTNSSSTSNTQTSSSGIAASASANSDGASASIGIEAAGSNAQRDTTGTQSIGVVANVGGKVNIDAANDATLKAVQIQTGDDFNINVGNDLLVTSAQNTVGATSENDSWNAGVGIAASVSKHAPPSLGVYVAAGVAEGELESVQATQINSRIRTGGDFNASVGGDAGFTGATVNAEQALNLNVVGDLTVASVQDTGTVQGERSNLGGRLVVGPAGVSGSVSAGVGETDGSTAWVAEQTSLTGGSAVDITVGGHTQLDGAMIAQIDTDGASGKRDGGNLAIDTGTLGITDIAIQTPTPAAMQCSENATGNSSNATGPSIPLTLPTTFLGFNSPILTSQTRI